MNDRDPLVTTAARSPLPPEPAGYAAKKRAFASMDARVDRQDDGRPSQDAW